MRSALVAFAVLALTLAPAAAGSAKPKKPQVVAALAAKLGKKVTFGKLVGEAAPGRWVVLFSSAGTTKTTSVPGAAIVTAGAAGLAVDGTVALPRKVDTVVLFAANQFGAAKLADHDGDGKPELLVTYDYYGPVDPGHPPLVITEVALLNLDPGPTVALHFTLSEIPDGEDDELVTVTGKHKLAKAVPGQPRELTVTRKSRGGGKKPTSETVSYRWDASSDTWKK